MSARHRPGLLGLAVVRGREKPAEAQTKVGKGGALEVVHEWPEGRAESGAWRIGEFLGCQAPKWSAASGTRPWPCKIAEPRSLDLLVLDDLGLGFSEHEEGWPRCLQASAPEVERILVKGTP